MALETLEELIIERGLLKAAQVQQLQRRAAEQKKTLEQIIRDEKLIYPEPLAQLKAASLGVPYVDLSAVAIDERAMQGISSQAAITYQFVPFAIKEKKLQVAMASPDDYQAQEAVRFIAMQRGLTPDIYCASPDAIARTIQQPAGDIRQALKDFGREFKLAGDIPPESGRLRDALVKAPVTKIVAVIIRHAIEGTASDIHIEPSSKQVRVRYRIGEQLHTTLLLPAEMMTAIVSRVKVLAGLPINPTGVPQEGRFVFTTDQQSYSVRVACLPTLAGERVTLQLVDATQPPPSFAELGMTKQQQALITKHVRAEDGVILIAGPGRAGKSTTLLASLWEINSPDIAITTLEDSIEFELPGISQTQIRPRQGLTHAAALASLLRQDFDVIMLSQLPDEETAELAARGAANGKRIFAAISAPDVVRTIEQLRSLHVSPYLLAAALRLLAAQRLVPQLCPSCREAVPIPRDLKAEIKAELEQLPKAFLQALGLPDKWSFFDSPGCPDCHEGKAAGQIALFELVPIFPKLRRAIVTAADNKSLTRLIRAKGYPSLRQDGIIKALRGNVRYDDVVGATA
jgi:type IV pilus assembly protein PilB